MRAENETRAVKSPLGRLIFLGFKALENFRYFVKTIGFLPLFKDNINVFREVLNRAPSVNGYIAKTEFVGKFALSYADFFKLFFECLQVHFKTFVFNFKVIILYLILKCNIRIIYNTKLRMF